jgi:hypothetical protein
MTLTHYVRELPTRTPLSLCPRLHWTSTVIYAARSQRQKQSADAVSHGGSRNSCIFRVDVVITVVRVIGSYDKGAALTRIGC